MTDETKLNCSVNHNYKEGYQQGRADAIDELLSKCEQYNYTLNSREFAKVIREQLKAGGENEKTNS